MVAKNNIISIFLLLSLLGFSYQSSDEGAYTCDFALDNGLCAFDGTIPIAY